MSTGPQNVSITPLEALKRLPLMQGLPEQLLQELVSHVVFKTHTKGQVISPSGQQSTHLVMVVAGQVQAISLSEDGRQLGLQQLGPGDFRGELSVIDQQPSQETLVAMNNVLIALLPAGIAKQLFVHHPVVADRILQHLCQSVRNATQAQSVLAMGRAQARIYHLLLRLAKPITDTRDASLAIENLPNQQVIAMMANVSRESVSRAIHALIKQNILRKDSRRLIVTSPDLLAKLARGEAATEQTTQPAQ